MPQITVYKGNKPSRVIELEISKECPICHAGYDSDVEEEVEAKEPDASLGPYAKPLPSIQAMPSEVFEEEAEAEAPQASEEAEPGVGGEVTPDAVAAEPSAEPKPKRKRNKRRKSLEEQHRSDIMCKPCDGSLESHNRLTHHPKHPDCPICNGSKIQRSQCRKRSNKKSSAKRVPMPQATKFAHSITLDHIVLRKEKSPLWC